MIHRRYAHLYLSRQRTPVEYRRPAPIRQPPAGFLARQHVAKFAPGVNRRFPLLPFEGSRNDSETTHYCLKDRGILPSFSKFLKIHSSNGREVMTYRLCYEDKTVAGNDGSLRIERFRSETEALSRARLLLDDNENYTMTLLDDDGEVACGVRLQLKLGYRVD
jgi:hypothetical protein